MKAEINKVVFEDKGQDFTEWYVESRNGVHTVIDCQPFQGLVWVGSQLKEYPEDGAKPKLRTRYGEEGELGYRIKEVIAMEGEEVEELHKIHARWKEMIGEEFQA